MSTLERVPCPVPGCTATAERHPTTGAVRWGPHFAAHRRRGDPGVPPAASKPKGKAVAKPQPKRARPTTADLVPTDIADGVVRILYPESVPTGRVRAVADWIAHTDRITREAWSTNGAQP